MGGERLARGLSKHNPLRGEGVEHFSAGRYAASSYSALSPRSLTTLLHFTFSSRRNVAYCSGVLATISNPILVNCSRTFGCWTAATISLLRRLTISFGVAAGARMPNHVITSKPGKPDSAIVGNSGATVER